MYELERAPAKSGSRPRPVIYGAVDLDTVNNVTHALNMAWLISRVHSRCKQRIPSWSASNEACSIIYKPITTIGMMPILQAPANHNDTVTKLLNRSQRAATHLKQKHVILVGDPSPNIRTKELCWENPERYDNVIVLTTHPRQLLEVNRPACSVCWS